MLNLQGGDTMKHESLWDVDNKCRAGFTLIELSIVLVIIGLVVGGVLVGRDLICAAELRAQISQIEKYNTAVNTFYGKYGGLPGPLAADGLTI
jgi:prepilin-type N-terminal cleavage/methylation domain-containing protein